MTTQPGEQLHSPAAAEGSPTGSATRAESAPPAKEPVRIEVITRAKLRAGPTPWADPSGIAGMSPEKRRAILENPLLTDDEAPVQLLGVRGDSIIGRLDLIHGVVNVGGQETPIAWGSEWVVPPEHRGSLVGVSLLLKQASLYPNQGAAGPSQQAQPVYQKMKWASIPLPRWILLRRSRSVVERYAGKGPHTAIGAAIIDVGLRVHRAALRMLWGGVARRWRLEAVDRFPAELEPKLADVQARYAAACHRSAAWLNWLMSNSYTSDPRSANLMHLVRARDGRCVGYTVSKVRFFPVATHRGFKEVLLGAVMEYASFDAAISEDELVRLAVLALDRHGVDAIEVSLENAAIGRDLKRVGFMRVGTWNFMYKASPRSPLGRPDLAAPGAWRTRPIDGDNFFV